MHVACIQGRADVVKLLIARAEENLLKMSLKDILNAKTKVSSLQPVARAFWHCLSISIIYCMLTQDKWTPLMYAVKTDHIEVVKVLLEQESLDVLAKNKVSCPYMAPVVVV